MEGESISAPPLQLFHGPFLFHLAGVDVPCNPSNREQWQNIEAGYEFQYQDGAEPVEVHESEYETDEIKEVPIYRRHHEWHEIVQQV